MSDLRDRIAALLEYLRPVTPREAADAVIAELSLRPDRVGNLVRYVSEWETNDG